MVFYLPAFPFPIIYVVSENSGLVKFLVRFCIKPESARVILVLRVAEPEEYHQVSVVSFPVVGKYLLVFYVFLGSGHYKVIILILMVIPVPGSFLELI
jgi:hypothetical protein